MADRYTAHMPSGVSRRLLTTADYHSMIEAGILGPEDRVELLAGEIYEAASIGSPHAACVMRLNRWFSTHVGERALVNPQNPVEISDISEPEPDISLLEPREGFYADRNPRPDEVLLLIEVAASSYEFDRTVKLPLYAESGIREVWIIALERSVVEVYREPGDGAYRWMQSLTAGDTLTPLALRDLTVDVAYLLG